MAPNLQRVEQQTFDVLACLFQDDAVGFRDFSHGDIEHDGPEDDSFDAVIIADKLRSVADALNEDVKFKAALNDLKKAAAQEALDQVLSSGIDALVRSQVSQMAEVAPELQIIKASVAFCVYMKKTCPNMQGQLRTAMGTFLNQRVGPWITQQGGWEQVANVTQP